MYEALVDLLPPSSIDFVLEVNGSDLLVVRVNVLETYRAVMLRGERRIKLVNRHTLAGRVLDIVRIPNLEAATNNNNNNNKDRIILAFSNGHYSILSWDHTLQEWRTYSLHSFNRPEYQTSFMETTVDVFGEGHRLVAAESEGRCVLARVNRDRIAILPLDRNARSRVFEFATIDERIHNVVDFSFLPGYMEPTLAILYEPTPTWPYRYPVLRDTLHLIVCTMDTRGELPNWTSIATYTGLATDARRLWCTSAKFSPIGKGLFLCGSNTLIHIDPGNPTIASLSTNCYVNSKMAGLRRSPSTNVTIRKDQFVELKDRIWLCSGEGDILECSILRDGGGRKIDLSFANSSLIKKLNQVHSMTLFNETCLFVVPPLGDALFVDLEASVTSVASINQQTSAKGAMDSEIDDIYNESHPTNVFADIPVASKTLILASLPVLSNVSDFCVGGSTQDKDFGIVVSSGSFNCGRVTVFKNHLPMMHRGVFNISNCQAVHSIGNSLYIVSSSGNSSLVLSAKSGAVKEIRTAASDGPTVMAENLGSCIIQVGNTIRVLSLDLSKILDQRELQSYSPAKLVKCTGTFIAIEHIDSQLTLYQIEEDTTIRSIDWSHEPILAWDIFTNAEDKIVFAYISKNGRFVMKDLESDIELFVCTNISHLPIIVAESNSMQSETSIIDITGMALIKNQFDELVMVLSSASSGLVVYRQVNALFIQCPTSVHGSILSLKEGSQEEYNNTVSLHKTLLGGMEVLLATSPDRNWLLSMDHFGYPHVYPLRLPHHILSVSSRELAIFTQSGSYELISPQEQWKWDYHLPYMVTDYPEAIRSIVYHSPSNTYGIISMIEHDFELPNDEFHAIADNEISLPAEAIAPKQFVYTLKLLSSKSWAAIDEYSLNEDEYATCLVTATLETKQTASGRQPFLVVGTSVCRGEDRPARGRVLAFDVISVVPEEDQIESDRKLKLLADEEMKGPVTALAHLNGQLLVSLGSKIIVHSFEGNESLTGIAFADTGVYGGAIASLRNFYVLGDICKSLALHAFQEKPAKVVVLARDFAKRAILAVEFVLSPGTGEVTIVASDDLGNIHFFAYEPTSSISEGGQRLVSKGNFRFGDHIIRMKRIVLTDQSHACLILGASGQIVCISHVDEGHFRTLYGLQLRLNALLPYLAGLTPRMAYQSSTILDRKDPVPRTLLDFTHMGLMRLFSLPATAREHLVENTLSRPIEYVLKSLADVVRPLLPVFA